METMETMETMVTEETYELSGPFTKFENTPRLKISWSIGKDYFWCSSTDWLLESIVSKSLNNSKGQLCKIVERPYIKDPWINRGELWLDSLDENYFKRSILFDANRHPLRINYYYPKYRFVGVGQPEFLEDEGYRLKEEEVQTDELGRKTYWGRVYDQKDEDRFPQRDIYEYFYEYRDKQLFRKVLKVFTYNYAIDYPTDDLCDICYDHLGLIQSFHREYNEIGIHYVNDYSFKHTLDESGDVIRTDITLNGKFVISVCRKYYYSKI